MDPLIVMVYSSPLMGEGELMACDFLDNKKAIGSVKMALRRTNVRVRFREEVGTVINFRGTCTSACDILHFAGHGLSDSLILEGSCGISCTVKLNDLGNLLRAGRVLSRVVILSTCYSEAVAQEFVSVHVPHVIAIRRGAKVSEGECKAFDDMFWKSVLQAFREAQSVAEVQFDRDFDDQSKFILLPFDDEHNEVIFPNPVRGTLIDESQPPAYAVGHHATIPILIGRNKQTVSLLKHWSNEFRLVSVRGHAGVGKTAFLRFAFHYALDRYMFDAGYFIDLDARSRYSNTNNAINRPATGTLRRRQTLENDVSDDISSAIVSQNDHSRQLLIDVAKGLGWREHGDHRNHRSRHIPNRRSVTGGDNEQQLPVQHAVATAAEFAVVDSSIVSAGVAMAVPSQCSMMTDENVCVDSFDDFCQLFDYIQDYLCPSRESKILVVLDTSRQLLHRDIDPNGSVGDLVQLIVNFIDSFPGLYIAVTIPVTETSSSASRLPPQRKHSNRNMREIESRLFQCSSPEKVVHLTQVDHYCAAKIFTSKLTRPLTVREAGHSDYNVAIVNVSNHPVIKELKGHPAAITELAYWYAHRPLWIASEGNLKDYDEQIAKAKEIYSIFFAEAPRSREVGSGFLMFQEKEDLPTTTPVLAPSTSLSSDAKDQIRIRAVSVAVQRLSSEKVCGIYAEAAAEYAFSLARQLNCPTNFLTDRSYRYEFVTWDSLENPIRKGFVRELLAKREGIDDIWNDVRGLSTTDMSFLLRKLCEVLQRVEMQASDSFTKKDPRRLSRGISEDQRSIISGRSNDEFAEGSKIRVPIEVFAVFGEWFLPVLRLVHAVRYEWTHIWWYRTTSSDTHRSPISESRAMVHGFVSRDESQRLLETSHHFAPGLFLIRFSDSMPGNLAIAFVPAKQVNGRFVVQHALIKLVSASSASDLEECIYSVQVGDQAVEYSSLAELLRVNKTLETFFPDTPKSEVLESLQKHRLDHAGQLNDQRQESDSDSAVGVI